MYCVKTTEQSEAYTSRSRALEAARERCEEGARRVEVEGGKEYLLFVHGALEVYRYSDR